MRELRSLKLEVCMPDFRFSSHPPQDTPFAGGGSVLFFSLSASRRSGQRRNWRNVSPATADRSVKVSSHPTTPHSALLTARQPIAVCSIRNFHFAPRHLGAYTLLPPSEPFQRIFPLRDGPSSSQPPAASPEHLQWSPAPSVFSDTTTSRGPRDRFSYCPSPGYPVGTGSPAIRPSMLANNRLVR